MSAAHEWKPLNARQNAKRKRLWKKVQNGERLNHAEHDQLWRYEKRYQNWRPGGLARETPPAGWRKSKINEETDALYTLPTMNDAPGTQPPGGGSVPSGGGGGGGGGGGSGGGGGGGGSAPKPPTQAEIDQMVREQFPGYAWLLDHREIGPLLRDAIGGKWSAEKFQSRLIATNWWRTHGQATRNWLTLTKNDPAEATARRHERQAEVHDALARLGAPTNPRRVQELAEQSLKFGIEVGSAQFNDLLVSQINFKGKNVHGEALAARQQVQRLGRQYGIPMSEARLDQWTRRILAGESSIELFQAEAQSMAQRRLTDIARGLGTGATVEDYKEIRGQVRERAAQLGIVLDRSELLDAAHRVFNESMSSPEIDDYLVGLAGSGELGVGQIKTDTTRLQTMAQQYLTKLDAKTASKYARQIAMGNKTMEDYQALFQAQAVQRFSGNEQMVDAINRGVAPIDLFQPHRQAIADTLEVSVEQVDLLNDPRWSKVIGVPDEKGGQRPMTYSEAMLLARQDDSFKRTRGAQEQSAEFANMLGKTFGRVG